MGLLINTRTLQYDPNLLAVFRNVIEADSAFFSLTYPHFHFWLRAKVIPGLVAGKRTVWIEQRDNSIVGLLILKHSLSEKKLCTLRVRDGLQNRGVGLRLFERAFELLEMDEPLLSVADSNLSKFQRIFDYFGFRKEGQYPGLYRSNSTEFSFNGLLVSSQYNEVGLGLPAKPASQISLSSEPLELLA